jgi:transposase-like protein
MAQDPKCPDCGQPMVLQKITRAPHPADDQLIFRCTACNTDYIAQDRVPIGSLTTK